LEISRWCSVAEPPELGPTGSKALIGATDRSVDPAPLPGRKYFVG
jgi:hypothetical protein